MVHPFLNSHANDGWTTRLHRLFQLLEKFRFLDMLYSIAAVNITAIYYRKHCRHLLIQYQFTFSVNTPEQCVKFVQNYY